MINDFLCDVLQKAVSEFHLCISRRMVNVALLCQRRRCAKVVAVKSHSTRNSGVLILCLGEVGGHLLKSCSLVIFVCRLLLYSGHVVDSHFYGNMY